MKIISIHGSLREVEAGAKRLAQVVLGASHLAQTAVPKLLNPHDKIIQEWKANLKRMLEDQANFLCHKLAACPGLTVTEPQGAMYSIVHIDTSKFDPVAIQSDVDFSALLLREENVFVLPGTAFGVPGVFRVVFCAPNDVLEVAANRIRSFCERHTIHVSE